MNDKPKLRDKFFSPPFSAKEGAKPASQSGEDQPKKESLEQILQGGFNAEMKGMKIGCLLLWHIGGFLLALLLLLSGFAAIYQMIFG